MRRACHGGMARDCDAVTLVCADRPNGTARECRLACACSRSIVSGEKPSSTLPADKPDLSIFQISGVGELRRLRAAKWHTRSVHLTEHTVRVRGQRFNCPVAAPPTPPGGVTSPAPRVRPG